MNTLTTAPTATTAIATAPAMSTDLTRVDVVHTLAHRMAGQRWAFQGSLAAVPAWLEGTTMDDLDVWIATDSIDAAHAVLVALGGVLVCATSNPRRLMHRQYWLPTVHLGGRGSLVDITIGDLRVGPTLLIAEADVTIRECRVQTGHYDIVEAPVLAGAARVADLAVRPLLRGRIVTADRLGDAGREYARLSDGERCRLRKALLRTVGGRHLATVTDWLEGRVGGTEMQPVLAAARRRLTTATIAPRSLVAGWQQRRIILPARRTGPVGMRSRGVVVALVGTDGSGKSTTATHLGAMLTEAGFTVDHCYFGMARGNLPGLQLVRRLVGGGDTTARPGSSTSGGQHAPTPPGLLHQLAAWAYVADYWWRSIRRVRPAVRKGHVVLCDRWVSDLRRHPVPDSPAARVAEWLVGAPDVFLLADAPVYEIVARKPERTLAEAGMEQDGLRHVGHQLHGRPARGGGHCDFQVINTSAIGDGTPEDRLAAVVRRVVGAAHDRLPHG